MDSKCNRIIDDDTAGNDHQILQQKASRIIGAEYIAQSEREGIPVVDISMTVWERNNLDARVKSQNNVDESPLLPG